MLVRSLLACSLLVAPAALADDAPQPAPQRRPTPARGAEAHLVDGSVVKGIVLDRTASYIVLRTPEGDLRIAASRLAPESKELLDIPVDPVICERRAQEFERQVERLMAENDTLREERERLLKEMDALRKRHDEEMRRLQGAK